ncbi:IS110 family RNA-guided transposase [Dactylosporangium darangshiense]|uniref:IS110 family transposase n=1 Tax=Dactylosporangium darangshiense TaxID=579108 RepID=A0ABP8DWV7_9ACTN
MDVLHERAAALDIGKRDLKACVRTPHPSRRNARHSEVRTFDTTTNSLLQLRDWLVAERVSIVVMEATGDYWRPPFYLLEDVLNVILVNAAHAKNLPGRKSDVADAVWLAQLAECGLLRASFVPPEPIRQLRDLTRYRTTLLAERSREAKRLEKELEDAGIKLSSVATDLLGVSGRLMLQALINGERDPVTLAQLAKARMRRRIPDLIEALVGNFGEHHAFLCRLHLQRIDQITATVEELSARISEAMEPFRDQLKLLDGIPGVGPGVAEIIIAETGGDMTRFPTAGHLASWAGVCPGMNESAGRHKPGHTRHGNRWLTGALGTAAMAAARTKDTTFIGARYRRLAGRIGRLKALVAAEHTIITAVWHVLSATTEYHDLGGDHHLRRDPDRARHRAIRALNQLGYTVTLNPIQGAA